MSDQQDITICAICRRELGFTPRLGDWIMHPRCKTSVDQHVASAIRMERNRIKHDVVAVIEGSP